MKQGMLCAVLLMFLVASMIQPAFATESMEPMVEGVYEAAPEEAQGLREKSLMDGIYAIGESLSEKGGEIVRSTMQGGVKLVLVLLLCSLGTCLYEGSGGGLQIMTLSGALAILWISMGEVGQLLGMGLSTLDTLSQFSKDLFPALAAVTAATGMVSSGAVRQVTTVFCCELLLRMIHGLLVPALYGYLVTLAAGTMLSEGRLTALAGMIKKGILWVLTLSMTAFSLYISLTGAASQATDAATLRVAKRVVSTAIPVVGNLVAGATEAVVAGASILKNTIGIFGVLAILATCAIPFLQLGVQYLLYKLVAFLVASMAAPPLTRLIEGIGSVFGLLMGMVGSCGIIMTISILNSLLALGGS